MSTAIHDGTIWRDDRLRPLLVLAIFTVLAIAVILRTWSLDTIPGLNGDEAWAGVQAELLLRGEAAQLRTPTGNPLNPLFFGPLLLLESLFGPAVATLRAVSLTSGLLALLLNYWLAKRLAGISLAVITTVLLAVLPVNIAYSRFAWDTSQTLLITLPVLYAPLLAFNEQRVAWRWWTVAILCLAVAVVVHPTNIFTAPLIVVPLFFANWNRIKALWDHGGAGRVCLIAMASGSLFVAVAIMVHYGTGRQLMAELPLISGRIVDLLSGVTVLRFIPGLEAAWGEGGNAMACLLTVLTCGLLLLATWGWLNWPERPRWSSAVLTATLVTFGGFHIVAGPKALEPHFERYGLCLIAPLVLIIGSGLNQGILWRPALRWGLLGCATVWLFAFCGLYYGSFLRTAGASHHAFQTGEVEPKLAALRQIIARHDRDEPLTVVTSEWWSYWPLRYLAAAEPSVQVLDLEDLPPQGKSQYWQIDFVDSPPLNAPAVERALPSHGFMVRGYGGRPVLTATYHAGDD